jgi:hypothetical protein
MLSPIQSMVRPSRELTAQAGIEPVIGLLQACITAAVSEFTASPDAQLRAQKLGELRELVAAWPHLSPELRTAVLAVTRSAGRPSW